MKNLGIFILICIESFLFPTQTNSFFNHVKGMAIEYNNKIYTLNFEQQNQVIQILKSTDQYLRNEGAKEFESASLIDGKLISSYNRLIIYRFEKANLELIPIAQEHEYIIFEVKEKNNLVKRIKTNTLHALLSQTFEK
jgi:hypothetical protein